ncbi:uncharacterized protein [Nicotiana tomentosiformis]|uniref:uncharacterized protein n=1 Tax=Nicotiana tomentosiformis TaxID=4098 RepID=UPI00388C7827
MAIREETVGDTSHPATTTSGNVNSGTGETAFPSIDHNYPLFLQPTDTPCSTMISLQLTGSDNYALWSRSMRIGLLGKSKLGFADGRFPKSKFKPELHDQWETVNVVVLSWIMNTVWEDLNERFDKVNESRVLYFHREIHTLTQGTMSVVDYFSKLRDLWDEFDTLMPCPGCPCPESKKYAQRFEYHRLLQFLTGLNESYLSRPFFSRNRASTS